MSENATTFSKQFFALSFLHSKLKKDVSANLGGTPLKLLLFQEKKNTKKQTQPLMTETATQRQTKTQLS